MVLLVFVRLTIRNDSDIGPGAVKPQGFVIIIDAN